jgi:2-furoate---CoA ligase
LTPANTPAIAADQPPAGPPPQRITAFIKRCGAIEADALDAWCRGSSLADYKRPREYVFVAEIPKSPVGKILRRLLVVGEYRRE